MTTTAGAVDARRHLRHVGTGDQGRATAVEPELTAYARQIAANAGPLTKETRDKLRRLLPPPPGQCSQPEAA